MSVPFDIVIPARYHSERLPGKLLEDICGRSMINRVIDRAKTSSAERIVVAFDDDRIRREVEAGTDAIACPTSPDHPSGTDRVAEAVEALNLSDDRIVVNVQGDEPMIPGSLIDRVAETLHRSDKANVATAAKPIENERQLYDPNVVKCVTDSNGYALYFSRAAIPWSSMQMPGQALHHIGIYAYRAGYLLQHAKRDYCLLEQTERLEQLRVLYNGDRIAVLKVEQFDSIGVDTLEDLERVRMLLADS